MKYFFGFLVTIVIIILAFVLVIRGFSRPKTTPKNQTALASYASSETQVQLVVDGRIIAEQDHDAYRITVGRSEVRIETMRGYAGDVVASKTYTNTQEGYANFLRALDIAGFSKGLQNPTAEQRDERGVCANGRRYIFEIVTGSNELQRYWSTSCSGQGTFKGNTAAVKQLFDRQVPASDFGPLVNPLQI